MGQCSSTQQQNEIRSALDGSDAAFKPENADVSDDIRHEIMINGKKTVYFPPAPSRGFWVGDRVFVDTPHTQDARGGGKVAWVGNHKTDGKPRVGVILDNPTGNSSGNWAGDQLGNPNRAMTENGFTYFSCDPDHGCLVPPHLVLLEGSVVQTTGGDQSHPI